jgi:hypothetical protein
MVVFVNHSATKGYKKERPKYGLSCSKYAAKTELAHQFTSLLWKLNDKNNNNKHTALNTTKG